MSGNQGPNGTMSNGHDTETYSSEFTNDENKKSAFVHEILQLPAIVDSVTTIHGYANNNMLGRFALEKAGTAVTTLTKITNPVQARFQTHISKADEIAASSVGYFGDKFPIVREPTDKIIDKVKQPALQTFETVKQYQESFSSSIDQHVTTPAKSIATSVQGQLDQHVALPAKNIAKKVDASLAPVVDNLEAVVQKWLPDEVSREVGGEQKRDAELSQTFRALSISVKAQRFFSRRVKEQIISTQVYTADQLKQLQESNALLQKATETVNLLNERLLGLVLSARQNAVTFRDTVQSPDLSMALHDRLHYLAGAILGELDKEKDLPHAVQARIIELSQALLTTTDSISQYVKSHAKYFPEYLQVRLNPLVTFFNEQYTVVITEISKSDATALQKARNIVQFTSSQTLPILQKSMTDLQESVQAYRTSLNNSLVGTTQTVKSHIETTARALNVK